MPDACKGAVVAIGNFDGVHRGHQALIAHARSIGAKRRRAARRARLRAASAGVLPPDAECFRLTPFRTKARLLAEQGVDVMYALPFDAEMAKKAAEEFVRDVLVNGLGVRGVVVGADFRFGKARTGDSRSSGWKRRQSVLPLKSVRPRDRA